jgi:hypothetical protein
MASNLKIFDTYIAPATDLGMSIGSADLRFVSLYIGADASIGGTLSAESLVISDFSMVTDAQNGYVLTCNAAGVGTWQQAGTQFMIYPGVGIALSTGTGWGTSITDNSSHWNTAYGWGNHSNVGYLTSIIVDPPLDGEGTHPSHLKFINPGYIDGVVVDPPLYGSGTLDSHLTVNVSNLQPKDATLTALSGLDTSTGYIYQTGADTFIKASGAFVIESRTSDPLSPATGQVWLRTDI